MSLQAVETLTATEAATLAKEAFLFGLPPVYIAMQADQMTNVSRPIGTHAPVNQFGHYRDLPVAGRREVVGINVDTLYSFANLDLSQEPIILSVPEMGNRWWIMQAVDAWNEVAHAPGSRTVGGRGGNFALVGPSWTGFLPEGVSALQAGTDLVFLAGRTFAAGRSDFSAVHKLQDQFRLTPLSHWGKPYSPSDNVPVKHGVDTRTPLTRLILGQSAEGFFRRLNAVLIGNPPHAEDAPLLEGIGRLGIGAGEDFRMRDFPDEIILAIDAGVEDAKRAITEEKARMGVSVNGWQVARDIGRYGTQYLRRAAFTFYGVGGNLAEDALYPMAFQDGGGKPLNGTNKYDLRFPRDAFPPADAFWSVTLYDADGYLVPNPLNRHALGDRSDLKADSDGSVTLHIRSDSPGRDREANWLPSPKGMEFSLVMRLYAPRKEATDGSWQPPAIKRV